MWGEGGHSFILVSMLSIFAQKKVIVCHQGLVKGESYFSILPGEKWEMLRKNLAQSLKLR